MRIMSSLGGFGFAAVLSIVLAGCSAFSASTQREIQVLTPEVVALVTGGLNMTASLNATIKKGVSSDTFKMACSTASWFNTGFEAFAPLAHPSARLVAEEQAAFKVVDAVCDKPPADVSTAINDVLAAVSTLEQAWNSTAPALPKS